MKAILKPQAEKQLNRIPNKIAQKIYQAILALENNPFPSYSKKLQSWNTTYRIRIGDYRAIYEVDSYNKKIYVTIIKHRKNVYR